MTCSRLQNTLSSDPHLMYTSSFDAGPRVPLPLCNSFPRLRGFSITLRPARKILITLLCCLTPIAVTAADEHLQVATAAVSTPIGSQLKQRDDTLVTREPSSVLAAEPDILCVALFRALSVRRIGNPFGVPTRGGLHPIRRCTDIRATRNTIAWESNSS